MKQKIITTKKKATNQKRLILFAVVLCVIGSFSAEAQTEWGKTGTRFLWQGLRDKQPTEEIPVGKAPFQIPQRVAKQSIPTRMIPVSANEWSIADGWELGTSTQVLESDLSIFHPDFNTKDWYNATVPGTVLTTLVHQGVYPEPAFGLNNMAIPDTLCRMDWWYRTVFDRPRSSDGNRLTLLFNGINYRAEVFLNAKKLGNIEGAFIRGEFDITDIVKEKNNVLAVLIHPPYNPGISHEQSMVAGQGLNGGQLSLDGPTFIASMGWDWIPGIRDRNMGIWQDVRLKASNDVMVGDPHIITNLPLPDTTTVAVTIHIPLKNKAQQVVSGTVHLELSDWQKGVPNMSYNTDIAMSNEASPTGTGRNLRNAPARTTQATEKKILIEMPYQLQAGEEKILILTPDTHNELNIRNPKLWWPNGYGMQNLYNLRLTASVGGTTSDCKNVRFGIRELSYELMIHTESKGNHRVLFTPVDADNGQKPVFNYEKCVYVGNPRLREAIPTLQDGVNEATVFEQLPDDDPVGQFLVFRVNGKRIFIKGATWGMDEMMKRLTRTTMEPFFRLEKEANFNMIRNWTGENTESLFYELADEYGLLVWNDFWITTDDTVDPNDHQLFLRNATDAVRRFRTHPSIAIWCPRNEGYAPDGLELQLNNMIAREDPTRHYHGNSRHLNAVNSGPYGHMKEITDYYTKYARGFNTELGAQAIPTTHTIRKFIAPEDLWPINDVWAYHDLHHKSQFFGDFVKAVNSYGEATDMEDFVKKGQMVGYSTWRAIIEGVNSNMWGSTTGLVLWMSHPSWPSMMWQTHTYDYETPAAYFGVKKAQEPIHIQMNLHDHKVIILNNSFATQKGMTATVKGYDINGKQIYSKNIKTDALPISKTECFTPEITNAPDFYLIRAELKNSRGGVVSINDYWINGGDIQQNQTLNKLSKVALQISIQKNSSVNANRTGNKSGYNNTNKIADHTDSHWIINVKNPGQSIAVAIKLNARDKNSQNFILPAYFSDGYFNLLPGESRKIELTLPESTPSFDVVAEGYNIR